MEAQEPTPEYQKGFNVGYQIAKADPQLFKQIEQSLDRNGDYIHGMNMGKKQHDRERLLEQLKQSQLRNRDQQKDR